MATKVASLFGVLSLDDSDFIKGLGIAKSGILDLEGDTKRLGGGLTDSVKRVGDKITEIGGKLTVLGGAINTILGPIMGFGQAGIDAAVDFDEAMKNIQAAAGYTGDEMTVIRDQVLAIGEASRYGPQEAALAFYEIAGGVSDASVRMAIFEASVKAAQAGNAELGATTKAMIGLMNAYGLSADEAGFASDVLTRIVGTGVGSMDEFGSALAAAAKFAPGLDIGLDDLGSSMSYLTTKNIPAAQSATILSSMMTTMLSPTKDLADAIHKAGYESGEAMIKAEGLTGAYDILKADNGGTLSGLITNTEALAGATLLATDEFKKFDDTFKGSSIVVSDGPKGLVDNMDLVATSIQGATADAEAIQLSSSAAQFDLLASSVDTLKIAVGDNLLPVLLDLTNNVLKPLVTSVTDWVTQNPQLATGLMLVVGAVALLGIGLGVVGTLMSAAGLAMGIAAPLIGLVAAALTWAGGAAGVMATAMWLLLSPIGLAILAAAAIALAYFTNFGGIKDFIDGTIRPLLDEFFKFLGQVWESVKKGVEDLRKGFEDAMTAIGDIIAKPEEAIKAVITLIGGWWGSVKGGIDSFVGGIKAGLQPVITFIQGIVGAIQDVIDALGGVQTSVVGVRGSGSTADLHAALENNAAGGPVYAGVPSVVGEQGREIFVPSTSGTIIPNGQAEGMMGGVTVSVGAIYAETAEGGRAAANEFVKTLKETLGARGGR
jgi:TP901 family phage tail tape measure protein